MRWGKYMRRNCIMAFLAGCFVTFAITAVFTFAVFKRLPGYSQPDALDEVRLHPAAEIYDTAGGRIETLRLPLANPQGHLPDENERLKPAVWFFESYSEARLDSFFRTLRAPAPYLKVLLDRQYWTVGSNGCAFTPPAALVLSLPADVRGKIYNVLAQSSANYPQQVPFRFPSSGFGLSLKMAGLKPTRVQQLERLTYTDHDNVCFADLRCAKESLSAAEFQTLTERLYETPTYRLRLHVAPESNVEALADYWGQGGREQLIHPLLKALSKVPGGASTSVSTLLPPYARLRLNTYPESWHGAMADQDCMFTALNFFNDNPDTNFLRPDYTKEVLTSRYVRIEGSPAFGDIILFLDRDGNAQHACVYIVADYVFTKNGVNAGVPWVIMKLADVLLTYQAQSPKEVVFIRRKQESAQFAAIQSGS
jgi:hypothetical protein